MRLEINAKGLTEDEVREAVESKLMYKNRSIKDMQERRDDQLEELIKLDSFTAEKLLGFIKKHHPCLLKDL